MIATFDITHRSPHLKPLDAARVATISLLTLIYGLSAIGLGVPAVVVSQSPDAYPCQHGRCGCRNAEQCWKSCCCHTDEEKLAWAGRNGVTPPAYVVAAVKNKCASRSCCASSTRSCCAAAQVGKSCSHELKQDVKVKWVSTIDAARCRGEAATWMNVVISLPANTEARDFNPLTQVRGLQVPAGTNFSSLDLTPPEPPPRSLVATRDV